LSTVTAQTTERELARPDTDAAPAPLVESVFDEDDRPRARWERAVGWVIVAIATWLVFSILDSNHNWTVQLGLWGPIPYPDFSGWRFGDLFLNTTANGGDMGAHVWWPKFLETHWFPKGRLSGWAPDWYAGFPVGQYYFPLPAVLIAVLDHLPFVPYNVAFKLVTVSGPLLLPAAAYSFARGLKAPWPAPPAFALAATGMLVQTRGDWQIYGGNIASTLAGEFSFTLALACALFGLGALAVTLDTGRRRWLPAALIAAAILSHIVVGIFIALAATLLWLTRRPWRTWPLAVTVGGVAVLLSAVWWLPLYANQRYTQSMRYTKLLPPEDGFALWSWLPLPGFIEHPINQFVRALGHQTNPTTGESTTQLLWLPWWILGLAAVAIVAAGWYRRRSTFVLVVLGLVLGVMFVQWPQHAIWNTRFLPFWLLTWGFVAAMGATEILRWLAMVVAAAYRWVREGDLQDARARAWAELATADDGSVDDDARKQAAWALAERRFDTEPPGWEPPERLAPGKLRRQSQFAGALALAIIVGIAGVFALRNTWQARKGNPAIAISGWAAWNYSGYERKGAWPQYQAVLEGMDDVARTHGNGRALWEPSSGEPDAINSYGTSLALELLPHYTDGRIGSMEGIYFESSATTSYHFLTVSECARYTSNPVRGLKYGSLANDFDMCVPHLQTLGVRYLMLWTDEANAAAAAEPDLRLIKEIEQSPPLAGPQGSKLAKWKVYEVADSDLVVGMDQVPVVAATHAGEYSDCWNEEYQSDPRFEPHLEAWECTVAPWWTDREALDVMFAQSGPKEWRRVDGRELAQVEPQRITPVEVSDVHRSVDEISFRVEELGKPVLVKESFYPNWEVSGARGPYRISPNLMVVIPTEHEVTLSYGLTFWDWAGRVLTVLGLVGIVLLALWTRGRRFAAGAPRRSPDRTDPTGDASGDRDSGANGSDGPHGDGGDGADSGPDPPTQPKEAAPALP
jgi:hypothetical protein